MALAVETTGLTKHYGAVTALSDLDLQVETGQVFGYLGPNGAGKTTTIRMLLALQRPTRGQARTLGLDCQRDSLEVHRRSGYLPGDLALYGAELLLGLPHAGSAPAQSHLAARPALHVAAVVLRCRSSTRPG